MPYKICVVLYGITKRILSTAFYISVDNEEKKMKVKEQVLLILRSNAGEYISGEEMANKLFVSRNAVWKAIQSLRKDGFEINAVTNKGYCINDCGFNQYRINALLCGAAQDCKISCYDRVSSTNTVLRALAENGAEEKNVCIANHQTDGRGRHGHKFYSPPDSGIYMSILLRPDFGVENAAFLTAAAAVAAVRAIRKTTGQPALIKWVNDILCDGKKICGILTEAVSDFESGTLQYAVVGLGINVTRPKGGFPSELQDIASALYSDEAVLNDTRCAIAAEVLNAFFDIYSKKDTKQLMAEYKSYSAVIGKKIRIISGGKEIAATAVDIDDRARLIARDENGKQYTLSSGEITV